MFARIRQALRYLVPLALLGGCRAPTSTSEGPGLLQRIEAAQVAAARAVDLAARERPELAPVLLPILDALQEGRLALIEGRSWTSLDAVLDIIARAIELHPGIEIEAALIAAESFLMSLR